MPNEKPEIPLHKKFGYVYLVPPEGVQNLGFPAGDHYHAMVAVGDLISLPDLLLACQLPLDYIMKRRGRIRQMKQGMVIQAE
eukprot:7415484-Pyramimonas_sp.AAC.1